MHDGCTFNHRYVKPNPQEIENATWMLTVSSLKLYNNKKLGDVIVRVPLNQNDLIIFSISPKRSSVFQQNVYAKIVFHNECKIFISIAIFSLGSR